MGITYCQRCNYHTTEPMDCCPECGYRLKGQQSDEDKFYTYIGIDNDVLMCLRTIAPIVHIPAGVSVIGKNVFRNGEYIEELTVPEGVAVIDEGAFFGCKKLRRVSLPKSLKVIEADAFKKCVQLKNVDIPQGIEFVDAAAFELYTKLNYAT